MDAEADGGAGGLKGLAVGAAAGGEGDDGAGGAAVGDGLDVGVVVAVVVDDGAGGEGGGQEGGDGCEKVGGGVHDFGGGLFGRRWLSVVERGVEALDCFVDWRWKCVDEDESRLTWESYCFISYNHFLPV